MLSYKLVKRANPRDRQLPPKWYATPYNNGRKSISDISDDVATASSLSRGDIQNVILSLVDQVPKYLLDGKSVELGELGILRVSFSSEGVNTEDEFNASRIDSVKIIFTPGSRLKEKLARAHFEAV